MPARSDLKEVREPDAENICLQKHVSPENMSVHTRRTYLAFLSRLFISLKFQCQTNATNRLTDPKLISVLH